MSVIVETDMLHSVLEPILSSNRHPGENHSHMRGKVLLFLFTFIYLFFSFLISVVSYSFLIVLPELLWPNVNKAHKPS